MEPFDTDRFITEIKNRPMTWNSLLPEYSNKVLKRNGWDEICQIFYENFNDKSNKEKNLAVIELQKKWKSIKDAYNRDKAKRNCPSGFGAKPRKPYVYSRILTFLDPLAEIRPQPAASKKSEDVILEIDEDGDFQKPKTPKKSKINPKNEEDPKNKLYEALTANVQRCNETKNEILTENPDKLFLISLANDFSAIKDEFKLEAKADMINLIRKYKNMGQSSRTLHGNRFQELQYEQQYGYQSGYQSGFESQYPANESTPRDGHASDASMSNFDINEITNDSDIITDMYDSIDN